jgi:hypothetical protein
MDFFENKLNFLLLPSPSILVKHSPLHGSVLNCRRLVSIIVAPHAPLKDEHTKHLLPLCALATNKITESLDIL